MFSLDELKESDINSKTQQIADMLKITEDQAKTMLALFVDTSLMAMEKKKEGKDEDMEEEAEEVEIDDEQDSDSVMVSESNLPMPF